MDTKKLRQKILDLAIRGKLVPQDPNDEPASVLLERIKAEKEKLIKEGKIKKSKQTASVDSSPYEKLPFEIPESWVWTTLGDITNYGETKIVPIDEIPSDNIVVELEDIESYTATLLKKIPKSERDIKGVRNEFHKGNLLYSKLRTYLNKVLVADCNGFCSTEIIPIDFLYDINSSFFCYVMRSNYFLDYTAMCVYGNRMPRLSSTDARKACLPLPPLAEQKRIASEVKRLFALIDIIEEGKSSLEDAIKQAKRKVLELAVSGKLCDDNRHYEKYAGKVKTFMLEELLDYEQPQAYIVDSTDYCDDYQTPVLTAGKSFIIGRTNENFGICNNLPVIIFDDFTTDSKYVDFPFKVKSSAMKILKPKNSNTCLRYIAAFMSITKLIGKTHKRYWISEYSKLEIQLPPYEEQLQIVRQVDEIFAFLDKIYQNLI